MKLLRHLCALALGSYFSSALGAPYDIGSFSGHSKDGRALQDIVTWDEDSFFVRGERVFLLTGEYQPFRLPVPSLWIDNFQKIKAAGFNAVSFYTYWPLYEGKPGEFTAEGVFALDKWFQAAKDAGIYLIARPGPYINSETSGGGFPGWVQRVKGENGTLRTNKGDFLLATQNYVGNMGKIIADAQITNGGPVILVQPENEYSEFRGNEAGPDGEYMQHVIDQYRGAGIVVPFINNDAFDNGFNAPGTGTGEMDIYGFDSYPIGNGCWNPYEWPANQLKTGYWQQHLNVSAGTPHAIPEFQGGAGAGWDVSVNYDVCAQSVNEQFGRVVYKNNYAAAVKLMNLYMTAGGTNWGNIGSPHSGTSYDVGSMIREDRTLNREAYSSMKLQGQFFRVTPAYLTSRPLQASTQYTNDSALTVTPLVNPDDDTGLFVLRHSAYESMAITPYTLSVPSSRGNLTIPALGGSLLLNGRDSKIHVVDYDLGGEKLLYSSGEVLTWKKYDGNKRVLVLYGGPQETHEASIVSNSTIEVLEGPKPQIEQKNGLSTFQWQISSARSVLKIGNTFVYLLDRNEAYKYFIPLLPSPERGAYGTTETNADAVIVKAGYLVRSAEASRDSGVLSLAADFNGTTTVEVIGAPGWVQQLNINGEKVDAVRNSIGNLEIIINYETPTLNLPDLSSVDWKYADSLPEITAGYDDSMWPSANHQTWNNQAAPQYIPFVLAGSEYGFHSGYLVYRGHFTARGNETKLDLTTAGGMAYSHSVWLDETYIGSWEGSPWDKTKQTSYSLPNLEAGVEHVLTVVVDNHGQEGNFQVGVDDMKSPRGIINYSLGGTEVNWKITGNLGGEDYKDRARGPLNEGGSYAERQGWHLPQPPSQDWNVGNPLKDEMKAGIRLYTTEFDLNVPEGWDVPLDVVFSRAADVNFSVHLFVNGWQFGKFLGRWGAMDYFPVPEGILNYRGKNTIAITSWSQAKEVEPMGLKGIQLRAGTPVISSRSKVDLVESPSWEKREGAY
ncbi:hypothetical protein CkaCkLH20_08578 [Colletotrichum karsti]|uniref:Beta-galactosidase n=1 Tax=Colletotrichum karsti TaxID=1095194 RepID=A0A9P6I046_9PEZI|nr:uncharacterized protein CkaCkLH20_08578 [Colletotrichum karsti]KAF9873844.1 hypothetical protein CkaCkLH20_08578 [Colletotrichum karsti]